MVTWWYQVLVAVMFVLPPSWLSAPVCSIVGKCRPAPACHVTLGWRKSRDFSLRKSHIRHVTSANMFQQISLACLLATDSDLMVMVLGVSLTWHTWEVEKCCSLTETFAEAGDGRVDDLFNHLRTHSREKKPLLDQLDFDTSSSREN